MAYDTYIEQYTYRISPPLQEAPLDSAVQRGSVCLKCTLYLLLHLLSPNSRALPPKFSPFSYMISFQLYKRSFPSVYKHDCYFPHLKKKNKRKMREETVWGDGKVLEIGNGILKTKKK